MQQDRTSGAGESRITGRISRIIAKTDSLFNIYKQKACDKFFELIQKQAHNASSMPVASKNEFENSPVKCCVNCQPDVTGEQAFTIRIKGNITADQPGRSISLAVKIYDITNDPLNPTDVYIKNNTENVNNVFEYICDLGKLPDKQTILPDWISVGNLKTSWMTFARKGQRLLKLKGFIVCAETSETLCHCADIFNYTNPDFGYLDLIENEERAKLLAVTLAFSICSLDGKMYKAEIDTIEQWAHKNLADNTKNTSKKHLKRALSNTLSFFKNGCKVDIVAMCDELAVVASPAMQYDIIELCMNVVAAKKFISGPQLKMLKDLANVLDIEPGKFRTMLEQIAPVTTHKVKDFELILGLGSDISREQARIRLNDEYRKWNARVTNTNPEIQTQARQMLELITQARSQYLS